MVSSGTVFAGQQLMLLPDTSVLQTMCTQVHEGRLGVLGDAWVDDWGPVRALTGSSSSGSKQPCDTRVTERPNISRISAMAALLQA